MALVCVPPMYYVLGNASSMSLGVIGASVFTILLLGTSRRPFKITSAELFTAIVTISLLARIFFDLFIRPSIVSLAAYGGLFAMLFAARGLSSLLLKLDPRELIGVFKFFAFFLVALPAVSLAQRVTIHNYADYLKNVFPFSEPSHFAIFCMPLIAAGMAFLSSIKRILFLAVLWLCALMIPSSIMAGQLLLLSLIFLFSSKMNRVFFVPALTILILLYIFTVLPNESISNILPDYFSSRIQFRETQNLSSLVYLQSWERTMISLQTTYGFGVGFQNLEILEAGRFGEQIFDIINRHKNLNDGGTFFAKIVGELGFVGLIFSMTYLWLFFSAIYQLPGQIRYLKLNRGSHLHPHTLQGVRLRLIANFFITVFIFEMFGRGVGYFSLGLILFAVGVLIRSSVQAPRC